MQAAAERCGIVPNVKSDAMIERKKRVAEMEALYERVRPLVPDIDPMELMQIVGMLVRPPASRLVRFLHRNGPNSYVF